MFSIVFGQFFFYKAIKSHKKWQIIKILIFLYFGNELKYNPIRMDQLFEY
jgi:hypothetical protein